MKLFTHTFIVSSVLLGGDVFFNNAHETRALMADSRRVVATDVRLQVYHISTFVERKVDMLLPNN